MPPRADYRVPDANPWRQVGAACFAAMLLWSCTASWLVWLMSRWFDAIVVRAVLQPLRKRVPIGAQVARHVKQIDFRRSSLRD